MHSPNNSYMQNQMERFSSFGGYPAASFINMIKLSQYGFYFTKVGDRVKCFSCGCFHEDWKPGDDPLTIHKQLSPRCQFLKDLGELTDWSLSESRMPSCDQMASANHGTRMPSHEPERVLRQDSVRLTPNPPYQNSNNHQHVSSGIVSNNPKYPKYSILTVRISSFDGWPTHVSQTPRNLGSAGLFYCGEYCI